MPDALRELLSDPRVAVPFFGRLATAELIDRYLVESQSVDRLAGERFLLALGPQESVLGAARALNGAISFFVAPSHWGRGIGSELVAALCVPSSGEAASPHLSALVYRENVRSQRLVEAAGFSFSGLQHSGVGSYAGRSILRYERRPRAVAQSPRLRGFGVRSCLLCGQAKGKT